MAINKKGIRKNAKTGRKTGGRKSEIKKGNQLVCGDCGLVVTIDDACGCSTFHEVVCCGEPMAVRECY